MNCLEKLYKRFSCHPSTYVLLVKHNSKYAVQIEELDLRSRYATRLPATIRGSNPDRSNRFSLLQNVQIGSGVHPASYSKGTGVPSREQRGLSFNYSPPSSTEVKNEWSYTSIPPICLHGVDREIFTFIVISKYVKYLCFSESC
jgi:hypothetical protein